MPLTTNQKIEVRKNSIRRMEFEMEDLKVSYSVQENLDRKDRMEKIEEDMKGLQKSINLVEKQIRVLENENENEEK